MLKSIEVQLQLPIIEVLFLFEKQKQIVNIVFCQEGAAQYSHNFIDATFELELTGNYCHCAIGDDSNVNLYTNPFSVFPQKDLMRRCPFIHLKKVSTAHLFL